MSRKIVLLAALILGIHLITVPPAQGAYVPTPGICLATTYTISYTDAIFKGSSPTATKTLFTLGTGQKLCGATNQPKIAFADASLSAMTCSLGTATSGNSAVYLQSLNMMQTAESVSQGGIFSGTDLATPDSNLTVMLTCLATGGSFGTGPSTNLTAGKAWITVWITNPPNGK